MTSEPESISASFDSGKIESAVAAFRKLDLNEIEALLASGHLAIENLRNFRARVQELRRQLGDAESADFARHELNDLISDLQDAIAPTIRAYNALLRDPDEKPGAEPG